MDLFCQIGLICLLSAGGGYLTWKAIPQLEEKFIKAGLCGIDLCKKNKTRKIAESQGAVAACIYILILFTFIPIQFHESDTSSSNFELLCQFLGGLLSIVCMMFLGFADDVLDLRWGVKLFLPMGASIPLLVIYALTYANTTIIVPKPLRYWLGFSLNLSYLYYLFLMKLAIFCTNAINILAGINGIEAGQSIIIASSIVSYNIIELIRSTDHWQSHIFSLNMMLPYIGVTAGLLRHNWFPSRVFVGDTFCYFSGMTFAVVGILGHFSKTMLLFFIPQVVNFLYSCPQLFKFVDCPRHRLPKYDAETDRLVPSTFTIDTQKIGTLGALMIRILRTLGLVSYKQISATKYECSNLTIINLALVICGPTQEGRLTFLLMVVQVFGTLVAFAIRYGLSQLFY